jgi:DNA replication protein DnaC
MPYAGGTVRWTSAPRPILGPLLEDADNAAALESMRAAIHDGRPVVLFGAIGSGKTTIMAEMEFWTALRAGKETAWTDADGYAEDVRTGWRYAKRYDDWGDRFSADGIASRVPALFLDDLGNERPNNVEHVMGLLRERHQRGLPTWATTNFAIEDLAKWYTERIVSRLLDGAEWVEVGGGDRRARKALGRRRERTAFGLSD